MKNPWMSAWLSAANSAVAPARGLQAVEFQRQQNAMMKVWTERMTRGWMQMWMPWMSLGTSKRK